VSHFARAIETERAVVGFSDGFVRETPDPHEELGRAFEISVPYQWRPYVQLGQIESLVDISGWRKTDDVAGSGFCCLQLAQLSSKSLSSSWGSDGDMKGNQEWEAKTPVPGSLPTLSNPSANLIGLFITASAIMPICGASQARRSIRTSTNCCSKTFQLSLENPPSQSSKQCCNEKKSRGRNIEKALYLILSLGLIIYSFLDFSFP
jgi:hypothetical protein